MKPQSPVIIIGMSRSGTSMLTRVLDSLGLFCGSKLTNNHEKEARSHVESLGDRAMEIKYEDFLEEPARVLETLSEFAGLEQAPTR